jgi:hypothetical protein
MREAERAPARKTRKKNVFRHPLHSILRLLMAPTLCATAAAPAFAADVDEVSFTVTIARSSEVADEITAELRVQGTGLNNGSITFPSSATPVALQQDGDDLALGIDFDNEAQLAATLPAGNYALQVNNGTIQATIAYQRPSVPWPDISQPEADAVLPSGLIEVQFTACPVCNQLGDAVEAQLVDGAQNELASETLTASDNAWTPPDGMGGDLTLSEDSEFRARIRHSAVRQANTAISGADELTFLFTHVFIQSDEVGFRTGFSPPSGDFCVVVNDPAPPAGCSPLDNPLLALLDTSGTFSTSVAGLDVDYTVTVGPKGTLTGDATADLDDDGSQETVGAIKGKLKGKGGELKQKLSFPLVNDGLPAKLKLSLSDVLSIPLDSFARVQKASGSIGALKVAEETLADGVLPFVPLGWRVNFTIDAAGAVQNGLLTLDGGRSFVLEGTNKFSVASKLSSLKLQTADKGIKLQLKKVELDDEASPTAVVGGELRFKILGQNGKAPLP